MHYVCYNVFKVMFMRCNDNEFYNITNDILNNDVVQSLNSFKHHYGSNRFEHSFSVAYYSYKLCKLLGLDYISAARAGLLHDLFLYDCESTETSPKFHIWTHPKTALINAENLFILNKKEKDIILKHMWPTTFVPPKYFESFIVSCVDKYCAFIEWSSYCAWVKFKKTALFFYGMFLFF